MLFGLVCFVGPDQESGQKKESASLFKTNRGEAEWPFLLFPDAKTRVLLPLPGVHFILITASATLL